MKISCYSELWSHPNKKLEDHLKSCGSFSKSSFLSLNFENAKFFSEISFLIGISHDFAKATSFFQNYLRTGQKTKNKNHSFLSAIFTFYVVKNYLEKEKTSFESDLAIISYIVVLAHHGNLKNVSSLFGHNVETFNQDTVSKQVQDLLESEINLKGFYEQYDIDCFYFLNNIVEINQELSSNLLRFSLESNFNNYFYILILYSTLLDADKMDASQTDNIDRVNIASDIVDDFKQKNFEIPTEKINLIREESYQEVNKKISNIDLSNKIYSINLPTGIGKTLTGFSSVLKLKDKIENELHFKPRIIYSLPFLSIIDQNEEVIRSILGKELSGNNYLLKHNHLSDLTYTIKDGDVYEDLDLNNSKILIEGWNSEIIITTFIQFFYSIFSNKNRSLRKFHNISNSIILLDEIQSIPHKYWDIINIVLKKMADYYNCFIILMTATQPLIFKKIEIIDLVENTEYYFNQFDRIIYKFNLENKLLSDFCIESIKIIKDNPKKDILFVLNTIDSSKELYLYIKNYFSSCSESVYLDDNGIFHIGDDIQLIYLSTNILPFQRLKRIESIKTSKKRNIIVSTQLIEAGVDIDVDIVYRDLAPLDSIIQTAGRCNRNDSEEKGEVNVISLIKENGKHFSNIYGSFLIKTTKEVLDKYDVISEKDFNYIAASEYFQKVSQRKSNDDLKLLIDKLDFEMIPIKFKLIENFFDKLDVFVCINQEAIDIWDEFVSIMENSSSLDRKNNFLSIKSKFYKHVISADKTKFGTTNLKYGMGIIYKEDLERKYNLDTGFISSCDESPMIWSI